MYLSKYGDNIDHMLLTPNIVLVEHQYLMMLAIAFDIGYYNNKIQSIQIIYFAKSR